MKKLFFLICAALVLSVSVFADASSFVTQQSYSYSGVSYSIYSNYDHIRFAARMNPNDSTLCSIIAFSQDSTHTYIRDNVSNGTSFTGTVDVGGTLDGVYTDNVGSALVSSLSSIIPYPADASTLTMCQDYLGSITPETTPDTTSTFSLPCGNVAYFQVSSAQTVEFKSTYQILSKFFANSAYGYWSDSGQRFGPAASLPTSSTSFPIASQDPLYWTPDPQSKNLLGLSKTGLASESCIIGQWYAFYNPAYNSNNTDWTTMDITGATVLISGSFSDIKIYPLEQVVDYQNGSFVGGSNDDYQSYFDGNIGADGSVSFTDQDGVSSVPTAGGQNLLAPNENAQSLVEKVVGILQNLLSEIQSLFTFGYDAIQSLVGIMSSFVSSFSQLYTWLPTEVYSALISAVIIAVVIGIFKVFL